MGFCCIHFHHINVLDIMKDLGYKIASWIIALSGTCFVALAIIEAAKSLYEEIYKTL